MPMNCRGGSWIDFVHQRIQNARGAVAVPPHVDARAKAAWGEYQPHVLFANDRLTVFAPLVDELGAALFLDMVVRGGGVGFCTKWGRGRVITSRKSKVKV